MEDTFGGAAVLEGGGDVGAVETQPEVSQGTDTAVEQPETQPEQPQTPGQQPAFDKDGRPTPQALNNALSKLGETDKKLADFVRGRYFKAQEFEKVFPTPQEALSAKETLEVMGGEEGLTQLRDEAQQYANELTMVANGDSKILDDIIADSKDGFLKLAPAAFEKLKTVDPALYQSTSMSGFSDVLRSSGFPDGINTMAAGIGELVDHIKEGRQQQAFDSARNLGAWFDKFKSMAKAATPENKIDPERQKFETEREEFQTQKQEQYRGDVNSQLNDSLIKPLLTRILSPLMKGRTFTTEQKQTLESLIYTNLSKEISADQRFNEKRKILQERQDTKGILNLFRPRLEELMPKVVKAAWASTGHASAAPRPQANGNAQMTTGTKPRPEDIDWTKDRGRQRFMSGEATLKNGKIAKWDWSKV
jgi:hypothetical protein